MLLVSSSPFLLVLFSPKADTHFTTECRRLSQLISTYQVSRFSPVDGNTSEREDAGDNDDTLYVVAEFADRLSERPLVVQVEQQLERHVDGSDERVADCQWDEEHVGDRAQVTAGCDDDDDEDVGAQRCQNDEDVDQHERRFRLQNSHTQSHIASRYISIYPSSSSSMAEIASNFLPRRACRPSSHIIISLNNIIMGFWQKDGGWVGATIATLLHL